MARCCTCVSCCERFNSMYAYSKHRVMFRCLSVQAMRAKGMAQNKNGLWVASRNQFYAMTMRAKNGDEPKVIPG